jgi:hypothetical protein
VPKTSIKVKLVGEDGNAFSIIGRVCRALREGGRSDLIESFKQEATAGNYDNLLRVVMNYVEVD